MEALFSAARHKARIGTLMASLSASLTHPTACISRRRVMWHGVSLFNATDTDTGEPVRSFGAGQGRGMGRRH